MPFEAVAKKSWFLVRTVCFADEFCMTSREFRSYPARRCRAVLRRFDTKTELMCLLGALAALGSGLARAEAPGGVCELSREDKIANSKLTFDQFDQIGVTPATWRQLEDKHGCHAQAVEAAEDYLIHAHFEHEAERRDVIFHIAQSLALSGKYEEAALMVASSKNPSQAATSKLDWNTYLNGTWAFLKKDKGTLKEMRDLLATEPGEGNHLNASVLSGLLTCFNKPYSIAYGCAACRPGAAPPG
jgi:hypothetical protein